MPPLQMRNRVATAVNHAKRFNHVVDLAGRMRFIRSLPAEIQLTVDYADEKLIRVDVALAPPPGPLWRAGETRCGACVLCAPASRSPRPSDYGCPLGFGDRAGSGGL